MHRPITSAHPDRRPASRATRPGYTLVEILVAMTLTLILMGAVMTMFGQIGNTITNSRAVLEMSDRLRAAGARLQLDLKGATATMRPPLRPERDEGYFEIIEGPVGPTALIGAPVAVAGITSPVNGDSGNAVDQTVGDFDDILMLTTRSPGKPFAGRCNGGVIQSEVAEVAWFLRGRTLYRRQLLVAPTAPIPAAAAGFYAANDVSVHPVYDASGAFLGVAANTLGELTKRECRYAHPGNVTGFPFDARVWGPLRLPTLRECSNPAWVACSATTPVIPAFPPSVDLWRQSPCPWGTNDPVTGTLDAYYSVASTIRISEDIILTNVIGFDVKVWDPGAPVKLDASNNAVVPGDLTYLPSGTTISYGAYVDLGWVSPPPVPPTAPTVTSPPGLSPFQHIGYPKSALAATATTARTYDTWSFHYEYDGIRENNNLAMPVDAGTNGFDDDSNGVIDDMNEWETMPPYPAPLRGVQIKIRVYEPDSRQIREVTIAQDFLPK